MIMTGISQWLMSLSSASGLLLMLVSCGQSQGTEEDAKAWLETYNRQAEIVLSKGVNAKWDYKTNLTNYNLEKSLEAAELLASFDNAKASEAQKFDWRNFEDRLLSRQFSRIVDIGYAILPPPQYRRMNELLGRMQRIYSTAKVCNRPGDTSGKCYPLDPDLTNVMATSTDWDDLLWAWEGWRNQSGNRIPDMYAEFVTLLNEAASRNGYEDNGAYWRSWYESDTFREECERLWNEVKPLYEQLHAYVRRKLQERYPSATFPADGHIPAHILGNMWAQFWDGVESLARPFPEKPGVDVTEEMQRQGYDADRIFRLSEEFFTSLGLIAMPQEFWNKSMIIKPTDRDVVCHASAWDFLNHVDFRIKQCTEVTMKWLVTTHHEMGHVQYYLQYKDQPVKFRRGANNGSGKIAIEKAARVRRAFSSFAAFPEVGFLSKVLTAFKRGFIDCVAAETQHILVSTLMKKDYLLQVHGFHEAIGDTLSLSVTTPEHLMAIGLLPDFQDDLDGDLNFLMRQALTKLAFLPFGYLIDQWRWDVFAGKITRADYNKAWWDVRCKYQGVAPPVTRSPSDDFDPGAKYHIASHTPYIRYFVAHILQFQFHAALCQAANNTRPLHRCDIYQSRDAGTLMGNMMKLGSSFPWPEALEQIAGTRDMSALPLMDYFSPLMDWLKEQNAGQPVGWSEACPSGAVSSRLSATVTSASEATSKPTIWIASVALVISIMPVVGRIFADV